MRTIGIFLILCIGVGVGCSSSPPPPTGQNVFLEKDLGSFLLTTTKARETNQYYIGVGDVLDVVFFFHEDLTTINLKVRHDGRITLPYVGDVMASGVTPMGLDSMLTDQFSEILRDPNLSVIVRETPRKVVYVLGQVNDPGGFPVDQNITLIQAISQSGGSIRGAKLDRVLVIRREGLDGMAGVFVNAEAILEGRSIQNDFPLKNNDIVYVPKTRLESAAELTGAIWDIIQPPMDMLLRTWQVRILNEQLQVLQDR